MKKTRKSNVIITFAALSFLTIAGLSNFNNIITNVLPHLTDNKSAHDRVIKLDKNLIKEFYQKDEYIDIYGIFQKVMGRQIIGNFEYISDDYGVINAVASVSGDVDKMVSQVSELQARTEAINTPLIYIQGPNKYSDRENTVQYTFNDINDSGDLVLEKLKEKGVKTYDMGRILIGESNKTISNKDLFLHTDLHMSTEGEILAGQHIADIIENDLGLTLYNKEMLNFNEDNYEIKHRKMLGNYGRNVGQYYVPIDDFLLFWPKKDTHYKYTNMMTHESIEGNFNDVCMSMDRIQSEDIQNYLITAYMRFGEAYYVIENEDVVDGPELCLITDSIGYRTIALLSQNCSKITILDPRYFYGKDIIQKAFSEQNYDAVILYQTYLMGSGNLGLGN